MVPVDQRPVYYFAGAGIQLGMACAGAQKRPSEQHHQVCYRYFMRGGGLWSDDAGGAKCPEQQRRGRFADVAGGQYSDADAGGTVPQPDWPGDHDPAGAGKNARPDDGAVVLRQRPG